MDELALERRNWAIEALKQPLDPARVRNRDAGGGRMVPYLEGFDLITTANRVFGFDGWSYRVDEVTTSTTSQGRIVYRATVTIEALGVKRTDVGFGIVEVSSRGNNEGVDRPEAHDTAYKGAATDALKRALRSFGAQFGNELYDKNDPGREQPQRAPRQQRATRARPQASGKVTNVGELMAWAREVHGLERGAVLTLLGVAAPADIQDLRAAAAAIVRAAREGQS